MANAKTSLGGIVKELDVVAAALSELKKSASPAQLKLLNAKIKKLGTIKSECKILCRHALNVNPIVPPSKKSKK